MVLFTPIEHGPPDGQVLDLDTDCGNKASIARRVATSPQRC
jgi:hypothetical protein